jgi:hypothetical protein
VSEHTTDAVLGLNLLCEARHGLQKKKNRKVRTLGLILFATQPEAIIFQNFCLQRALKVLL